MALTYRTDSSGLVVAEESAHEAAVSRALKELDDRFVLQKECGDVPDGWKYRVFRVWSEDQPPTPIVTWTDDYGNWLPLTMGIVDKVRVHMLGFRANDFYVDADDRNRRRQERIEAQLAADVDAIREEHLPRLRGRVSVSLARGARLSSDHTEEGPRPSGRYRRRP